MKKTISYILLTVIFVLALGGCGTKETQNYDRTDGTEEPGTPRAQGMTRILAGRTIPWMPILR